MNKRMKLNSRDLAPNPFRDIKNYPFNKEKIENLKNSIEETGFWENILARKPAYANYYEIAYGHHRLEALRELFPEGIEIEIPVKELSDSLMLRIMANENMDDWKLTARVVDETVRVTASFLKEHPEEILTKEPQRHLRYPGEDTDEHMIYRHSPLAFQIAEFLGSGWSEKGVYNSLSRLQMIEEGSVDKEAVHSMPSASAADTFGRVAKKEGLTPKQQKKVALVITKSGNIGEAGIKAAVGIIKNPPTPSPKKKKVTLPTDFDQNISNLASDIRKVNKGLDDLYHVLYEHGDIVVDKLVAVNLTTSMKSMYLKAEKILKASHQID